MDSGTNTTVVRIQPTQFSYNPIVISTLRFWLNLSKSHLFRYFQVRIFVKLNNASFPNIPPDTVIGLILDIPTNLKAIISQIYTLISQSTEMSLDKIKNNWEEDSSKWQHILFQIKFDTI